MDGGVFEAELQTVFSPRLPQHCYSGWSSFVVAMNGPYLQTQSAVTGKESLSCRYTRTLRLYRIWDIDLLRIGRLLWMKENFYKHPPL